MNNDKKAFISGIWYTVSNFFVRGIGLILTPIITRLLTKGEYGLYNNYTSWLSIASIFVTLNLEPTLISARFDFEDKFDRYILSMLALCTLSTSIWAIVINGFSEVFVNFTGVSQIDLNVMLVNLLFLSAINLFQARERYLFEYKASVITSLVLSISSAIAAVSFVLLFSNKVDGMIIGSALPTILIGVSFFVFFVIKAKKIDVKYWKYALPLCIPYIPHLLAGTMLSTMDRVMINKMCGSEDTAVYSLAYSCGTVVALVATSINSAFAPWLGEKISEKNYRDVRKVSKPYVCFFIILAVGVLLFSPELLFVLGGEKYMEAKYVIGPVAIGCICQFLYTMFVNVEQFKKKTTGMAIATVIAAAVNFILNCIFIPIFGYLAAAYTTLVGYLVLLLIHMFLVWKIGMKEIYSYRFIIGSILLSIVIGTGIILTYNHLYIRVVFDVIFLIVLSVIFVKYRNKLSLLWKK